jgi:DNA-binding GntR family transcriptional regulator
MEFASTPVHYAFPDARKRTRLDHRDMIKALRASWRDELIKLTRRHLKPSPQAYIRVYERKFGTSTQ